MIHYGQSEVYRFEWDAKGNIVREESFDGQVRTYERDYSGLVTRINRPGGRYTSYRYDRLGRVTRAEYHDKSYEAFAYNKNGVLTEAENQDTRIRLERDKAGRITREWQDSHWGFPVNMMKWGTAYRPPAVSVRTYVPAGRKKP